MSAYTEKLKDGRWQKKRLEILDRDAWKCQQCGEDAETGTILHVHHKRYFASREPWDVPSGSLVTLCASCHEIQTESVADLISEIQAGLRDKFLHDDLQDIAAGLVFSDWDNGHGKLYGRALGWLLKSSKHMDGLVREWERQRKGRTEKRSQDLAKSES